MKIYEGTKDEIEFYLTREGELVDYIKKGWMITMISFPGTDLNPIRVASQERLDVTDCDAVAKALGFCGIDEYKIQQEVLDKERKEK